MKKWIKLHSRRIAIIAEMCFLVLISCELYLSVVKGDQLLFCISVIGIFLWLSLLLWTTGVLHKIYSWWEKD